MTRITGFYLIGSFEKGKKPVFMVDNVKPFIIDRHYGIVSPKVLRAIPKNVLVTNWQFVEGRRIVELNKDLELREELNKIWEIWSKEHGRKYKPILNQIIKNESKSKNT